MSVCQIEERDAGRSYPRTCPTCKLTGPCAKGLDRKGMADRIEELEAKLKWVLEERDTTFALMLKRVETAEAKLAKAVEALDLMILHAHGLEGQLTEELFHQDFCGESVTLTCARTTLAELTNKDD